MASLYSTNLKLELIGTGDQSGLWGNTTNTNLGTALEQAIVGKASLVTGDFTANVATLTLTNTNASQTARAFVLDVTATLSAAGTINVPAIQKPYLVFNNTVGGFALTVKVAGLTGVSIPNGDRVLVYCNGTDVVNGLSFTSGGDVTLTGVQTITNKTIEAGVLTNGYTEEVFAVTGTTPALSPVNGSIQTWTLTGNSTPTAGVWGTGQSLTLMVDDGTAFSITWTSLGVTWKTNAGVAPTLNVTGFTAIQLWKVGATLYGARVGDA